MNAKRFLRVVRYCGSGLYSFSGEIFNLTPWQVRFTATYRKTKKGSKFFLFLVCFCLPTFISHAQESTNTAGTGKGQEEHFKQTQTAGKTSLLEGCWRWGDNGASQTFWINQNGVNWEVECLTCPTCACRNVNVSDTRIQFDWVNGPNYGSFSLGLSSDKQQLRGQYAWHTKDYTGHYLETLYRMH